MYVKIVTQSLGVVAGNEGVLQGFLQGHSAGWVLLQQLADKVDDLLGQGVGIGDGHIADVPVLLLPVLVVEGRGARGQLVSEHPQGPDVHRPVVQPVLDDLGAQVVHGAAHGLALGRERPHRPPEVRYLELVARADEDVLGLDVAVEHVAAVDVGEGAGHLPDVPGHLLLLELPLSLQLLVELAPRRVLHDVVDLLGVEEEPEHAQYVGVLQVAVDLDFPPDLPHHLRVLDLLLRQHLQGHHLLRLLLPRQVHVPELAPAQRPPYLEPAQVPVLGMEQQLVWAQARLGGQVEHIILAGEGIVVADGQILGLLVLALLLALSSKGGGLRFVLLEGGHQAVKHFELSYIMLAYNIEFNVGIINCMLYLAKQQPPTVPIDKLNNLVIPPNPWGPASICPCAEDEGQNTYSLVQVHICVLAFHSLFSYSTNLHVILLFSIPFYPPCYPILSLLHCTAGPNLNANQLFYQPLCGHSRRNYKNCAPPPNPELGEDRWRALVNRGQIAGRAFLGIETNPQMGEFIIYIKQELALQMEDHTKFSSFFTASPVGEASQDRGNLVSFSSFSNQKVTQNPVEEGAGGQFHQDRSIYYFNMFFSPKEMADSIKRRNDNLEMLNFQNSDEEPDDVFNRRKKKVADLITKEEEQLQLMFQIKADNEGKFLSIIDFIKFFCGLKEKLVGIRTDYYSSKTFCALKNANEAQLVQLTKVVQKMYSNIMKESKSFQGQSQTASSHSNAIDERIYEFLIIPRFLISRQKINRLSKDQVLQRNFEFLVFHKCLGHYNNEANKKMPEETQMVCVRELLRKKLGRQKFKKICSINHGNKFLKVNGQAYYELYTKSLEYLRQLDIFMKKGRKYESVKKELDKIPYQSEQGYGSSTYNENESSNNSIYNMKGLEQCLEGMEINEKESGPMSSEMRDEPAEIKIYPVEMKKRGPRKLMSMPLAEEHEEDPKPRKFSVRKSQTLQPKTTENIILVPPPFGFEV